VGTPGTIALSRAAGDDARGRVTWALATALAVLVMGVTAMISSRSAPSATGLAASSLAPSSLQMPAVASPAQLRTSRHIGGQERQFWAVRGPVGAVVTNAGQDMSASFTPAGVDVRVPGGGVGLSLVGFGRARRLASLGPLAPSALANRVSYTRGPLTEWYANGPAGLEQGLILNARPAPARSGPLTFAYRLSGIGEATVQQDQLLVRSAAGQPLIRYSGLSATDALGRSLPVRLILAGPRLAIEVHDARARYPIRVDPVFQVVRGPGFLDRTFSVSPNLLALTVSTGPTLSITALGAKGGSWDTTDEGNDTTEALMSLSVPASYGQITDVTPGRSSSPRTRRWRRPDSSRRRRRRAASRSRPAASSTSRSRTRCSARGT
jgi:hypothetical protein